MSIPIGILHVYLYNKFKKKNHSNVNGSSKESFLNFSGGIVML